MPRKDLLNAADLAVRKSHLYAVRVVWGVGQKICDGAFGQLAGALILLEDDGDLEAGADVLSFAVRHI